VRDGGFGHAVDGLSGQSDKTGLRTQVDDAAAFLANHDSPSGLASKESALEVHGQREVEIFFGVIFGEIFGCNTGVVDKEIEAAEVRGSVLNGAGDLVQASHIHLQGQGLAAEGLNFAHKIAAVLTSRKPSATSEPA